MHLLSYNEGGRIQEQRIHVLRSHHLSVDVCSCMSDECLYECGRAGKRASRDGMCVYVCVCVCVSFQEYRRVYVQVNVCVCMFVRACVQI
jgi:hypothetical protein